ncbi:MAG TPA: PKD domain-containing protein [Thermoplasmata archaeon]|nr:PKD domain-containing protein [Thermoplasmata archaeon]
MYLSGRRGFGALVMLIVLMVGAVAVLPMLTRGQTNQITGLVSTCVSVTPYVAGATVTLVDANGVNPALTTITNGAGVYAFNNPPSGSYTIAANRTGYYSNATTTPTRYDGSATVNINVCMVAQPTANKVLTVTVLAGGTPLPGATVAAYNISNPTGKAALVRSAVSDVTGKANLTLWGAPFQLRTSAPGYQTDESNVDVSVTTSTTINLVGGLEIIGHARNPSGQFVGSGLVAWLYDPTRANTSTYRLIPATMNSSLYDFHAPPGSYRIIIAANNYLAYAASVILPGVTNPYDVVLQPAPHEEYLTTVAYGTADWNNLTSWRNLTLNPDSTLTGLGPPNLRDLRLQIDATLGNGDGILSAGEITAFQNWFLAKGTAYVTTDGFLTTNGKSYISQPGYSATFAGLATPGSRVWINTTTTYKLKVAPPYIANGAKTYYVNMTLVADANSTIYQDYVYLVSLPKWYELNTSVRIPASAPITLKNFTRVTVDPGVTGGLPQLKMTISESKTGVARAKVTAPVGKFYVYNATFVGYQAYVANNTTLTFSAEDSVDPVGHIADANFTWRFTSNPGDVRYGMIPTFKYSSAGQFIVNLTVTQGSGNKTYRNITLWVDDQLPIGSIRTNKTGTGSANGRTLNVDEGTIVRFDGGLSTDNAYTGKKGVILDSGYAWDFDGDRITDATGRIVNWTLRKPGTFKVNLTVTDSVGWKGANATMTVVVNDTKAPSPAFDILDPTKDWGTTTSLIERRTYAFNASRTTDDHDKNTALNFTWIIPGPLIGTSGNNHTFYGMNISFAWAEWNNTYKVVLSARDTGFRGGLTPPKPNTGNLTRNLTVQIDVLIHSDLRIDAGTTKVTPGDPEEGAPVTVTANVSNKPGRLKASNVTTQVLVISGGQTSVVTNAAEWFDKTGQPMGTNHTINSGDRVKLVFHIAGLVGQGNKTLQVYVFDSTEPYTWITNENRASAPVNVRQPAWQPYAIWGSVIGVIALFVGGMYARRKIKAGEWRPIRGRRRERGEDEEKRPKKEVKEEKKRL